MNRLKNMNEHGQKSRITMGANRSIRDAVDELAHVLTLHISIYFLSGNALTVVYLVGSVTYALDTLCNWDVWYSAINLTIYSISIHGIVVLTLIIFYSSKYRGSDFFHISFTR